MSLQEPECQPDSRDYEVGYRKPPKQHQFKKGGPSPNPTGRPRKLKSDLIDLFQQRLEETIPDVGKKRGRISRLRALLRNLVNSAIAGEAKALTEIIRMLKAREGEVAPREPDWLVMPYEQAKFAGVTTVFDELFYRDQDQKVAQWKRELSAGNSSIKSMLEKELDRKVDATRNGKPAKVRARELIVSRFIMAANDDPAKLRQLLSIFPDKKYKRDFTRVEILRPNAE